MSRAEESGWFNTVFVIFFAASVFYFTGVQDFLAADRFAGRDLSMNYAFLSHLSSAVFPGGFSGIQDKLLMGFPGINSYPPGFFVLVSSVSKILGLGLKPVFKFVVSASVVLMPAVAHAVSSDPDRKIFLSAYSLVFVAGMGTASMGYQVFGFGFVSQAVSFVFLGVFVAALRRDSVPGGVAGAVLAVTALFHPYTGLTGLLVLLSSALYHRTVPYRDLLALLATVPWFSVAFSVYAFTEMYTMPPAVLDPRLLALLPLVLLGGLKSKIGRIVLPAATVIFGLSFVENPVVSQEARFLTQGLFLFFVLSGIGAQAAADYFNDAAATCVLLAIPLLLAVSSTSSQDMSSYDRDLSGFTAQMSELDPGTVLVETDAEDKTDSFVPHSAVVQETNHSLLNDVHLDSSSAGNYILTLESFVSSKPVANPICRTCSYSPGPRVFVQRLNSLGVDYVVTLDNRTGPVSQNLRREGYSDGFAVYSVPKGTGESSVRFWGVKSDYKTWKELNDKLFKMESPPRVYWHRSNPSVTADKVAVVPDNITESVSYMKRENGSTTGLRICRNRSWLPGYSASAATNFNVLASQSSCEPAFSRVRSVSFLFDSIVERMS